MLALKRAFLCMWAIVAQKRTDHEPTDGRAAGAKAMSRTNNNCKELLLS